jgi:hypothetical protein
MIDEKNLTLHALTGRVNPMIKTKQANCRQCAEVFSAAKNQSGFWKEFCSAKCARAHRQGSQRNLATAERKRFIPMAVKHVEKLTRH